MSDVDFSGVFDTSAPVEDASEETQEVAEPVEEETAEETTDEQGANDQEVAEPEQSDDDNAKYAAARRKAEREKDLAVKAAVEQARKELEEKFNSKLESSGLVNPRTQQPLKSFDEFQQWQETFAEEKKREIQEKFEEAGLGRDEVNKLVESHPDVIKAREEKRKLEAAEQKLNEQRYKGMVEESIKEIQEFDPTIKSVLDIANSEHGTEVEEMIRKGYKISDAWKIANLDKIKQRTATAAQLETSSKARSKEHLEKSEQKGKGGISIPSAELAEFKKIMPKATKEQIQKYWEKDQKRFKKKG